MLPQVGIGPRTTGAVELNTLSLNPCYICHKLMLKLCALTVRWTSDMGPLPVVLYYNTGTGSKHQ